MKNSRHIGAAYAVGAFSAWGLLPIYWKLLQKAPATEIMSHRMIWSLVFVVLLIVLQNRKSEFFAICSNGKAVMTLCLSSCIVGANWLAYIGGVNNGRIIETSLGYFICPLVNIVFGMILLKERLNRRQGFAVLLAVIGVSISIASYGEFPWIALTLAITFALYGYLRKIVRVESLTGLAFEMAVLSPFALGYLFLLHGRGEAAFLGERHTDALFIGTGIVTAVPLIWFAAGARKLRLSTLGFFQYLAPILQLIVGVFIYNEAFTATHLATFGFIWCALLVYSLDSIYLQRDRFGA